MLICSPHFFFLPTRTTQPRFPQGQHGEKGSFICQHRQVPGRNRSYSEKTRTPEASRHGKQIFSRLPGGHFLHKFSSANTRVGPVELVSRKGSRRHSHEAPANLSLVHGEKSVVFDRFTNSNEDYSYNVHVSSRNIRPDEKLQLKSTS